jgi:hypothetical protein
MIANCLGNSGLGDFFGQRIGVDEVRVFKPSPVVVPARGRVEPGTAGAEEDWHAGSRKPAS